MLCYATSGIGTVKLTTKPFSIVKHKIVATKLDTSNYALTLKQKTISIRNRPSAIDRIPFS